MKAVIVGSLPVPEDYYLGSRIRITCSVCLKRRTLDYYPGSEFEMEAFISLHLPYTETNDRHFIHRIVSQFSFLLKKTGRLVIKPLGKISH